MNDHGRFHESVPRELGANLKFRRELLRRARDDRRLQLHIMEACRQDFLFFVGLFVWQFNPIKADSGAGIRAAEPFIPWEMQKRAALKVPEEPWPGDEDDQLGEAGIIWCIENERSVVIEKSRELGASWWCLIIYAWFFIFYSYQKFHCISRNEEKVESDDPDSLFWKLDYLFEHLPVWMKPDIKRRDKYFGNERHKNYITGESSTKDAGISGRCRSMLMDEFAKIKNAEEVRRGTAGTTRCRIFNSTHEGCDTEFYALTQNPEIYKLRMHWTQHPDKVAGLYRSIQPVEVLDKGFAFPANYNFVLDGTPLGGPRPGIRSFWYDRMCVEIGDSQGIARDQDINPEGSVSQFFDPILIHRLIREFARQPDWQGELEYDKNNGTGARFVRADGGGLCLWFQPDHHGRPPHGRYGAGADISMGVGSSPSCFTIGNADTGEKFLEYQNSRLYPNEFAIFCFAALNLFRDWDDAPPLLCWEKQGPGIIYKRELIKLGYRRFWYNDRSTNMFAAADPEPGWNPGSSNNNKKILLDSYKRALREKQFFNPSRRGLVDTLAWKFDKNGGVVHAGLKNQDPSGARDNHGDQTIADALCHMCMEKLGISQQKKQAETVPMGSMNWRQKVRKFVEKSKKSRSWVS